MTEEKTVGQGQIRLTRLASGNHLSEMVRGTVALNAMLDAEADRLCGAVRYACSQAGRVPVRATASDVSLNIPKRIGKYLKTISPAYYGFSPCF
jgi:hypothetical protein